MLNSNEFFASPQPEFLADGLLAGFHPGPGSLPPLFPAVASPGTSCPSGASCPTGTSYPSGVTEQSFLKAFESVVSKLTTKWEFGYYGLDDLRQECFFFAWDCLNRYDPSRPLEPFLNTHINNRLRNLKRNKYHRADPPCKSCHDGFPCSDKGICERYRVWSERNGRKANLARPMPFDEWDHSSETFSPVELGEIEVIIDEYLPIELRKDYLRMREDCTISRSKMQAVRDYMKLILASGVYQESDNE